MCCVLQQTYQNWFINILIHNFIPRYAQTFPNTDKDCHCFNLNWLVVQPLLSWGLFLVFSVLVLILTLRGSVYPFFWVFVATSTLNVGYTWLRRLVLPLVSIQISKILEVRLFWAVLTPWPLSKIWAILSFLSRQDSCWLPVARGWRPNREECHSQGVKNTVCSGHWVFPVRFLCSKRLFVLFWA